MTDAAEAEDVAAYLRPTRFLDFDHPAVLAFAREAAGDATSDLDRTLNLYYAVRDRILYDPYCVRFTERNFTASECLKRGRGFCVHKATLLAAVARAVGVPARLGFADVQNHLCTERMRRLMNGSDMFFYHGYTEFLLAGRWVKATPAFNIELCQRFRVLPLEFNGREDSVFHPFDADGRQHMEYIADHGAYADVPYDEIKRCFTTEYAGMFETLAGLDQAGDFHAEAEAEN